MSGGVDIHMCIALCMCWGGRERERETETEIDRERERERQRERDRERQREKETDGILQPRTPLFSERARVPGDGAWDQRGPPAVPGGAEHARPAHAGLAEPARPPALRLPPVWTRARQARVGPDHRVQPQVSAVSRGARRFVNRQF